MSQYLDLRKVSAALTKALKQDEKQVTITLPNDQAKLLLDHVEYQIRQDEYCDVR
jgi:hypothetical protein